MKLEILKEQEVPLLNRKRISAMAEFEGKPTPSILAFKDSIATQAKTTPDLVAIRHVYQRYGASKAKVIAHVYKTRKELLSLEKVKTAEKKAMEAAKKAAEEKAKVAAEAKKKAAEEAKAAAEAKATEAPKEEAKVEGKAE
jgi:ribosomal protein S24E